MEYVWSIFEGRAKEQQSSFEGKSVVLNMRIQKREKGNRNQVHLKNFKTQFLRKTSIYSFHPFPNGWNLLV